MTEVIVEVPLNPSFILQDVEYGAGGISYDPSTAVLMIQWDRALAAEARRLVFPAVVDDSPLEVTLVQPTRGASVELREGSIALPALFQGEEYEVDLAFYPPPAEAAPRLPKFKIRSSIRARPTGGG